MGRVLGKGEGTVRGEEGIKEFIRDQAAQSGDGDFGGAEEGIVVDGIGADEELISLGGGSDFPAESAWGDGPAREVGWAE